MRYKLLLIVCFASYVMIGCEDKDRTKIPTASFDMYELSKIVIQYDIPGEGGEILNVDTSEIVPKLFLLHDNLYNGVYYDQILENSKPDDVFYFENGFAEKFQLYNFSQYVFWDRKFELCDEYARKMNGKFYQFPISEIPVDFKDTLKYSDVRHTIVTKKVDDFITLSLQSKNIATDVVYKIDHIYKATGEKVVLPYYGE
ncbi:hypothetical protein [Ancylomarina longa]|uniref:Uncharacterized protein n=1 Tax=Ancylomarina longa TaxID=2487017 RepID=A0A434AUY3_9BACT|nr:hypothetical protein [Ancylomarina longa]RUT78159.1 hypothetical protein DLK05_09955 [Ancylomarina longa]